MEITLVPGRYDHKPIFARLLELYLHDLSEFYEDLSLNEHGLFQYRWLDNYWTEKERFPYLIEANARLAGFVLAGNADGIHRIAEFFVLRSFRRRGVGAIAAQLVLGQHPGQWEISHLSSNEPARFWRSVIPSGAGQSAVKGDTVYRFGVKSATE